MARFYSNENFPLPAVEALRSLGHDVLTSLEAGNANQSVDDAKVLAFATQEKRALLTLNRKHFLKLHQLIGGHHDGIVLCTVDHDFAKQAFRIHQEAIKYASLNGLLLRVNRAGPLT